MRVGQQSPRAWYSCCCPSGCCSGCSAECSLRTRPRVLRAVPRSRRQTTLLPRPCAVSPSEGLVFPCTAMRTALVAAAASAALASSALAQSAADVSASQCALAALPSSPSQTPALTPLAHAPVQSGVSPPLTPAPTSPRRARARTSPSSSSRFFAAAHALTPRIAHDRTPAHHRRAVPWCAPRSLALPRPRSAADQRLEHVHPSIRHPTFPPSQASSRWPRTRTTRRPCARRPLTRQRSSRRSPTRQKPVRLETSPLSLAAD